MNKATILILTLTFLYACKEARPVATVENYSTTSEELQCYGDSLLRNKRGAIVAIDPSNGEILAMVSIWGKNYCSNAVYQPGTVFSLVNDIIAVSDGVIDESATMSCDRGYRIDNLIQVRCHKHRSPVNLKEAVMMGCSSYSHETFLRILENEELSSKGKALDHWREMVGRLGFGYKLNPHELDDNPGYIPGVLQYDRTYGETGWDFRTVLDLAKGKGEIGVTPLQLANFCAIIANRGRYFIPHTTREVNADGDPAGFVGLIDTGVSPECFYSVIEGMWLAAYSQAGEGGSAWIAHVDGLNICAMPGRTGSGERDGNGLFIGFAPKDNPRIAIAVIVEDGGHGNSFAAPIGSLMIEKYLTGSTTRKHLEERMMKANLLNKHKSNGTQRSGVMRRER